MPDQTERWTAKCPSCTEDMVRHDVDWHCTGCGFVCAIEQDEWSEAYDALTEQCARLAKVVEAARDVRDDARMELDDSRISYRVIQISRVAWDDFCNALTEHDKGEGEEPEREGKLTDLIP